MGKKKRKPAGKARPVIDRAREASEELEPGAPVVTRLADEDREDGMEGAEAAVGAGVTAAGESDRVAGTHVPPEYPAGDVPAEIDVDTVHSLEGAEEDAEPDEKLEGLDERPDDPHPPGEPDILRDRDDLGELPPTAQPRRKRRA